MPSDLSALGQFSYMILTPRRFPDCTWKSVELNHSRKSYRHWPWPIGLRSCGMCQQHTTPRSRSAAPREVLWRVSQNSVPQPRV